VSGWEILQKPKKKRNWVGGGEKIKFAKKKTEIRTEKGQTKKTQHGMAQG
jgi:hypothetical protein